MSKVEQRVSELEHYLAEVDRQIAQYEEVKAKTETALSQSFKDRLDELRAQHGRLEASLSELHRSDAQSWRDENFVAGFLGVWDSIGQRIDHLLGEMSKGRERLD